MGEPARGYSWPPFEPGHTRSMKHGATSERRIRPLADQFAAGLPAAAPWASQASFAAVVASWAWAEAEAKLLRDYLDEHGLLFADGEPRPASTMLRHVETRLVKLRAELGLTPASLARLLRDVSIVQGAVDGTGLEALAAEGRRIRLEAERRQARQALEAADSATPAVGDGSTAAVGQVPSVGAGAGDRPPGAGGGSDGRTGPETEGES